MSKCFYILLIVYLFISPVVSAGLFSLGYEEENAVKRAIKENNLDKLKKVLGKKISRENLIDVAMDNDSYSDRYICRTEIVNYLITKGYKPGEISIRSEWTGKKAGTGNLTSSVYNLCPEIFEKILPKLKSHEIAQATFAFKIFDYEKYFFGNEQYEYNGEFPQNMSVSEFARRLKKIGLFLKTENEKRCNLSDPINKNCDALEYLTAEIKGMGERQNARDFQDSPDGVLSEICDLLTDIAQDEGYINDQRKISQISGVANKQVLYQAGSRIVKAKKDINLLKQRYRKQAGKEAPVSQCANL